MRRGGDDRNFLGAFSMAGWLARMSFVAIDNGCKLEALGLLARADWGTSRYSFPILTSSVGEEASECTFPPNKESLWICSEFESVFGFFAGGARLRFSSGLFWGFSHASLGLMHLRLCSHSPHADPALASSGR